MLSVTKLGVLQKGHTYLPRRQDADLRSAVKKVVERKLPIGESSYLVVSGFHGVGKTASVANLVDSGNEFLRQACNFSSVIWFDLATLLIDVPVGSRENFLLTKLAASLGIIPNSDSLIAERDVIRINEYISEQNATDKVLLVFDHAISCYETRKFITNMAMHERFRCLLIKTVNETNDCNISSGIFETVEIRHFGVAERKQILKKLLLERSANFDESEMNRLAIICGGQPTLLHLINGAISCHCKPVSILNRILGRLSLVHSLIAGGVEESASKSENVATEIMQMVFASESSFQFARRYFAFLVFPPGEPVDIADLSLLWNCQDTDEALAFCQNKFVLRNMAVETANCNQRCFVVSAFLHNAAVNYAKSFLGTKAVKFIFNMILKNAGSKQFARHSGENILHLAIRLNRYRLVEAAMATGTNNGIDILQFLTKRSRTKVATPLSLLFASDASFELLLSIFEHVSALKPNSWLSTRRRFSALVKFHQHLTTLKLPKSMGRLPTTLLGMVVERNYPNATKFLLTDLPSIIHQKPPSKELDSALIWAVNVENVEMVRLLLENGADSDACSFSERSVLMAAISLQNATIARILLDHDANPNTHESLYYDTALIEASRNGFLLVAKLLLISRAHPDMRNRSGETALMAAAALGHTALVELLLKCKANVNAKDNRNRTALMRACEKGSIEVVSLLLKNGADVNVMGHLPNLFNDTICTALSLALARNHSAIARLLLQNGADSRKDLRLGVEALNAAVRSRSEEAIQLVLDYGIDVNATLPEGKTLLMVACQSGDFSANFVETLLQINADANRRDQFGETAFSYSYRKYIANPLSRQNAEKLHHIICASSPELFRGVWSNPAVPLNANEPLVDSNFFFMITHSTSRLEKLCALRVRQLLGPGYVSNKLNELILPGVVKDIIMLKQQ